jgi:cellulose synthase/poly-beta-1,6-N-acetylglucosamine synthase-like glycosyltransferase
MLNSVLYILFWTVFAYCAASVGYLFILSFWGRVFSRKKFENAVASPQKKVAILVPAYREDGIILSTANSLLRLDYTRDLYDIYIIADSFQPQTLSQLRSLPLHVLEVSFEKSTKTKSLNQAFARIDKPYDIALICDADNILARDFLSRINAAFVNGARAVQGRRVAKNLDTQFAILDACSEGINNHIFRKGANALGLSSSVIGSGMAFEFETIKKVLSQINAVGGFDKPMQLKIVQQGIRIEYMEGALVFDEKVDSSQAFKQQRKRWVSSQFIYLKRYFMPAFSELFKGNLSYFNLAMGNNLVLPRAFLLVILPLLVLISAFIGKVFLIASAVVLLLYMITMWIALPPELINKDLRNAILKLPRAAGIMFGTIFKMRESNKTFIHTIHTKTEINNPIFNEHSK